MIILYFLLTLLIFGVLVLVHEGGHFLLARLNGIRVEEFAIGMGPKLISRVSKKSGIRYSLRLLPIGGFVSMPGEDEESEDPDAFCNKSVWRRMLTILAGPLTNILIGFVGMTVLVCASSDLLSTTVLKFSDDAVSSAQLQSGDRILSVDGVSVHTYNEIIYEITNSGYEPIDITVMRDGERLVLRDVEFAVINDSGVDFGKIDFVPYAERKTVGNVIKNVFFRSISTIKMIWDSLIDMLGGRYGIEAISGPIGVTEVVGEAAQSGWKTVLNLFVILAMNLGVVNLLPIPALDGGRFVFLLIEGIMGRPLDRKIEAYINGTALLLLMAFMLLVAFKDIFVLIKK